ncbi:hypothetical protein J2Y54_000587 [Sphingomonas sp. BE123]|uniref:tail completion protein gp17 n=1 Tax=Sphingomonas sp. BE123 TaxID=2817842 RepID=UPI002859BBAA|nr:hypothetical protein [Sphingomonas sp. BE123]MDR6851094.1 hypothetical protein [Sphingomonas sp. BE123]
MDGNAIVGALLTTDAPLNAVVPSDRIRAAKLPDGIALPALLVRTISVTERQPLRKGARTRTVARVSVTVRATNYAEQIAVLKLVRARLRGWVGAIAGVTDVSIQTAGTGPDVLGPGESFEQAQDFRVSFDAPT